MAIAKDEKKIKRPIRTFEADKDVDEMLDMAQDEKLTLNLVCNTALRQHGEDVIRQLLEDRIQQNRKWISKKTNSKSTSTGAKVLKHVSDLDDQSQK